MTSVADGDRMANQRGVRTALRGRGVRRWRGHGLGVRLVLAVLAGGGVLAYAASVPLPPDPVVAQASVLYYRDGRTVLARVGANNRTDVALARIPLPVRRAVMAAE